MWDLVPLTRIKPRPPASELGVSAYQITRVPQTSFLGRWNPIPESGMGRAVFIHQPLADTWVPSTSDHSLHFVLPVGVGGALPRSEAEVNMSI